MIADILPACLASAEAFDDPPDATAFPEEEASVTRSVDKRRREFTTARHCVRRAFAQLGLPPTPVLPGPKGEPQWPSGIVGSITHCAGYRAAAVAQASDVVTIGIDAEPHGPLPAGVAAVVSSATERAWLKEYAECSPEIHWDRLLFSAKESVYKAWFPLAQRWLGFKDAALTVDPINGTFTARLLVSGPLVHGEQLTGFSGRWLVRDGLVLTAIGLLPPYSAYRKNLPRT